MDNLNRVQTYPAHDSVREKTHAEHTNEIEVRPLRPSDHAFINRLAREQETFSPPTEYLVWMYSEVESDASFIVTEGGKPVGYLLGQITSNGTFWVWQIATERRSNPRVSIKMLARLNEVCRRYGLKRLTFTMYPQVAGAWGVRNARRIFGTELITVGEAIHGEYLYELHFDEQAAPFSRLFSLPRFAEFIQRTPAPDAIGIEWREILNRINPRTVLEVGAGHGRRTDRLLQTSVELITAVEWDPDLLQMLRSIKHLRDEPRLTLVGGNFPDVVGESRYDAILLSHHVMLDLLSTNSLKTIVSALERALAPGGYIIFDYPTDVRSGLTGTRHAVFDATVSGIGEVQFSSLYKGRLPGSRHIVELTFNAGGNTGRAEIEYFHPPLEDVLKTFSGEKMCVPVAHTNASFFLPAQMNHVVIHYNATRSHAA